MVKKVFLIMGYSGSGKTSIVEELKARGYKTVESYTTRSPRYEGETGHIFCNVEEYEKFQHDNDIVAYSFFDGNHYFSLKEQLYACDIYVIDPDGIIDLKNNIDDIEFVTIYINTDEETRFCRMRFRGDSVVQIANRINNDTLKFENKQFDYVIPNKQLQNTVNIISYIIETERRN